MANRKKFIITLDGPASTGKTSIAKRLSKKLGYIHIDSGSMYRAATLFALRLDPERILRPNIFVKYLSEIKIEFKKIHEEQKIFLNDEDVSHEIREVYITNEVSNVAKIPELRSFLVKNRKNLEKIKELLWMEEILVLLFFQMQNVSFFLMQMLKLEQKEDI